MLVERGFIGRAELQSILHSALVDALLVLMTPQAGGSSVSDIRFEAPGVHWAAAFVRLPLDTVQSEIAHRAEQVARAGVAHSVPIALADLDRGPAVLTRDQWAIACRVNGSLTPRDLARQSGLALYDTITALGVLLRRGLCTRATPATRPATAARATPVADRPTPGPADVPRQVPNARTIPGPAPDPASPAGSAPPSGHPFGPLPVPAGNGAGPRPTDGAGVTSPPWPGEEPAAGPPRSFRDRTGPSFQASAPSFRQEPRHAAAAGESGPLAAPASPGPRFRPHDDFPPPGPRCPGDAPSASPAGLPRPRGTASPNDLVPPCDVPPWDEVRPPRDTESRRSADPGMIWNAAEGPARTSRPAPAPAPPAPAEASLPPVRRQPSFTPIATPAPLSPPDPAARPAAAPVPPAPADVPIVRPSRRLPPAHPGYRRPPRPEWSTAAPPVPSAVLAAMTSDDADPPDPDEPLAQRRTALPRRDPGAGLVQPVQNATEPLPIPAHDWRDPDPGGPPEPQAYAPSGPDLLRRVLDGLRRLT